MMPRLGVLVEVQNIVVVVADQGLDFSHTAVAYPNQNNFGWMPVLQAEPTVVGVLGHDNQMAVAGILPNVIIFG